MRGSAGASPSHARLGRSLALPCCRLGRSLALPSSRPQEEEACREDCQPVRTYFTQDIIARRILPVQVQGKGIIEM